MSFSIGIDLNPEQSISDWDMDTDMYIYTFYLHTLDFADNLQFYPIPVVIGNTDSFIQIWKFCEGNGNDPNSL